LKLDDPLSKYVPDFPNGDNVRISHLLSHTAGVPDFISPEEASRRGLEFEPGTRINYSNNGYQLLGRVIEKVSGQPWDEYLKEHIFAPLGMAHTGYDKTEELTGRATPYLVGKDGSYAPVPAQDARDAYAAGGLYSTVEDMSRWEQGLDSGKLLRAETLARATTPGVLSDGRETAYGFGWMTSNYRGLREVGHGGDITGFNTFVARYPDEKFTVIVLENMGMRPPGPLPDAGNLAHQIAAIWLAGRMQEPDARPNFAVSTSVLDSYVGRFKLDAPQAVVQAMGSLLTFYRQGDHLAVEVNGQKLPLDAKSATVFQAFGSTAVLTFIPGKGGKCLEVVVTLMGLREFHAFRDER
jgi:CubicO group peptidase (beta-lactamase class C family)